MNKEPKTKKHYLLLHSKTIAEPVLPSVFKMVFPASLLPLLYLRAKQAPSQKYNLCDQKKQKKTAPVNNNDLQHQDLRVCHTAL